MIMVCLWGVQAFFTNEVSKYYSSVPHLGSSIISL